MLLQAVALKLDRHNMPVRAARSFRSASSDPCPGRAFSPSSPRPEAATPRLSWTGHSLYPVEWLHLAPRPPHIADMLRRSNLRAAARRTGQSGATRKFGAWQYPLRLRLGSTQSIGSVVQALRRHAVGLDIAPVDQAASRRFGLSRQSESAFLQSVPMTYNHKREDLRAGRLE
jgi:hypothetical protein